MPKSRKLIYRYSTIPQASKTTIAVAAGVVAIIIVARKISKKIPGALIAVSGAILLSYWLNFSAHGVSVLGTVPSGLPAFTWPTLPSGNEWALLFTTATSIFLVILAQSAATSRAYAVKYTERDFSEDKDLIGLGGANIAAAATGTFVVNGSPTKTQMVDSAGGRSQIAQLTTAALVVIVLLFLTKPLAYMPNAVLAAVVFLIGVELVDVKGMKRVYQTRIDEFWVALITAAVVVILGVEQGIILAIVMSIIIHLRKSYKPNNMLITFENEQMNTNPVRSHAQLLPGLVVYHFGSSLYYANAESFQEEVLKLAEDGDPKVRWFVLEASAIGDIDYTGAETLKTVIELLKQQKVRFVVTHLSKHPLEELLASDVVEVIGRENIYIGLKDVTKEYRATYKVKLLT